METQKLSLEQLDDGGAVEAVNHEIQKILENLLDPNTEPKKERKVTLEIRLKGDEKRNICSLDYQAKSNLAPLKAQSVQVLVDRDKSGRAVASEFRGERREPLPTQGKGKVREMPTGNNNKE